MKVILILPLKENVSSENVIQSIDGSCNKIIDSSILQDTFHLSQNVQHAIQKKTNKVEIAK